MTDDDALDPVIVDRFRPLDDVAVPDTWNPNVVPLAGRRRTAWMIGAAAAAAAAVVVALVAGFVLLRAGGDPGDLATVDATAIVPPGISTVPVASATVPPSQRRATASPSVIAPGGSVTITPAGVVEHYCEKVNFFGPVTGTIMGGEWSRSDPVTATYSCDGPVTDAPVVVTIPTLADGDYRFCIAVGDVPEGCAVATISGDAPTAPLDNALATADPAVAEPGGVLAITPAATIERYCTDIVAVLPVGDGPVIGQVLGGSTWRPVPQGAPGPTWPACLGAVTDAPLTFTVPDVTDGFHRFCIAAGELPEGCAVVTVQTPSLLAIASPSEVAPGDAIMITPGGVVQPICGGPVLVYDVTRTEPVRLASRSGASTPPPVENWAVHDCLPESSDLPIEMVVPDIPLGTYAFCLSSDLADVGCARVIVTAQRIVQPTAPPGSSAPPSQSPARRDSSRSSRARRSRSTSSRTAGSGTSSRRSMAGSG